MSYARRVDANQQLIVAAAERLGATVQYLFAVGGGTPDLLIGYRGRNLLVEVKTETGELNQRQKAWHAWWQGQAAVVRSPEEMLQLLSGIEEY